MDTVMRNILRYMPPAALISFGWYAEITWYFVRFTADGNSPALSIAQGIALTLFLSVAVVLPKGVYKTALIGGLVVYSVFATTSGQAYNLDLVRMQAASERTEAQQAQRQIERFESLIADKLIEIDRLNTIKSEQTQTIADQSLWRTALANLNEDIAELESDVRTLESEKLSIINTGSIKPDDIYTRYSRLLSVPVEIVEALFQLALSLFIALMAPVGIYLWPKPQAVIDMIEVSKDPVEPARHMDPLTQKTVEGYDKQKLIAFIRQWWPTELPAAAWPKRADLEAAGIAIEEQRQIWRELKRYGILLKTARGWDAAKNRKEAIEIISKSA